MSNQASAASAAGKALKAANAEYDAAYRAPNNGSQSQQRLRDATTARDRAQSAFRTAYADYKNSMTDNGRNPQARYESESYFM